MSTTPEWITVTIVDVVHRTDDGPKRERCQIGLVRMPGSDDPMLASAIVGQDLFIFTPQSAALAIGALRRALAGLL